MLRMYHQLFILELDFSAKQAATFVGILPDYFKLQNFSINSVSLRMGITSESTP